MLQFWSVLFYIQVKTGACLRILIVSRSALVSIFSGHKDHEEHTKVTKAISIWHLLHFIRHVYQLMNEAISFGFAFSFLYGTKPYIMKHVVKGGILALVVICLYAFITVVASAL
jgi:hypothetical protein